MKSNSWRSQKPKRRGKGERKRIKERKGLGQDKEKGEKRSLRKNNQGNEGFTEDKHFHSLESELRERKTKQKTQKSTCKSVTFLYYFVRK